MIVYKGGRSSRQRRRLQYRAMLKREPSPGCAVARLCREPATNLADNLLRDYEQRWWGAVKKVGWAVGGRACLVLWATPSMGMKCRLPVASTAASVVPSASVR
jgi:hypothetical protein